MTIVKQVTQIRCDTCGKAYIYPEDDITQYLTANDWHVHGEQHVCPWCARKWSEVNSP